MAFKLNLGKFTFPDLSSVTSDDGTRVYQTPDGPAKSVTTILSSLPNPELDAWRERVGHEEADRISKEATTIGSFMHNMLEHHVLGTKYPAEGHPLEAVAGRMFNPVRLMGLKDLVEVWGVEVALHVLNIYAGRTDLVGIYKNIPSIIDYKTSIYQKKPEHLEKYKCQLAAYSTAFQEMFGEPLHQGVLLIGIRPNDEFKVPPSIQRVIVDREEMDHYKQKWISILEQFYQAK